MKSAFLRLLRERVVDGRAWLVGFEVSRHGLAGGTPHPRIVDLPISEETMLGLAVGLQRVGAEVFVDLMFDTFAFRCLDVLVNQIAITRLMRPAPAGRVVVRALAGPFEGAGPQHGGAGVAMLARLPHVDLAVPAHRDDVRTADAAFRTTGAPALLIMPAVALDEEGRADGCGAEQVRRFGTGSALGIVVLGPYLHLVLDAVRRARAESSVTVVAPLFLSPLPVQALASHVQGCERILVVDSAPPPVGLASELRPVFGGWRLDVVVAPPDVTRERYDALARVNLLADEVRATLAARPEGGR